VAGVRPASESAMQNAEGTPFDATVFGFVGGRIISSSIDEFEPMPVSKQTG